MRKQHHPVTVNGKRVEKRSGRPDLLRRIRIFRLTGLTILFWYATLSAQTDGKLAGSVTDAKTGEPLPGANIELLDMQMGAAAELDGTYYILNIPPGKYELRASMIGYKTMKVVNVIVNTGKTTIINFKLSEEILESEEVVVTAERPEVERDKTSTSAIVRFEEVQNLPGMRSVNDVIGLAADVYDGHFRGGREGEQYYTLQGMGIVNPLDNSSAFTPIMSGVEEVEVITSGFGAQYGNAQSGVVNISMKEGDRHAWHTRFESRLQAPGRKHFGPSVYDASANVYLQLLLQENVWLEGNPGSDLSMPYYGSMASGLTSSFAGDTTVQVAVARALWDQTRRDLGRTYGDQMDYSLEAAMGGPINNNMRMFMALRSNTVNTVFPSEQPDKEYQGMGNVVMDLGPDVVFRVSGGFLYQKENVFPSTNSVGGYQRWLWDRITSNRNQKRTNTQFGLRLTNTISQSTYFDLKLNALFTDNIIGSTPVPDFLPDSVNFNWVLGTISYPNNNSPDNLNYQIGYDTFTKEKTRTVSFDGSYTSQVTGSHLVNGGIQFNSYFIDVSNFLNIRTTRQIEDYTAYPLEAAVYLQDKMEFEGLIANVGLRFDLWYSGTDFYPDPFTPFGDPDSAGRFHPENVATEKPPIYGRLQPRLGFSFPVSVNTTFHLNYGAFMQRPSFQYIVSTRVGQVLNDPVILGNPRLKPETTNSYDVGVVQALGDGFTLDVSGYYKDVKNLVQQADFIDDRAGYQVSSYFNLDYADIRGFRIMLNKRKGPFTFSVNYQYGYATGKSATATAATPIFYRDTTGAITTDLQNVPSRDILLDFDRTHNLVITAGYVSADNWGPSVLDLYPLENVSLTVHSIIRSGRPYTSPSDIRLINVERSPMEYNTDMRITKMIKNFFGIPASIYFEVFNLFNNRTLNYDYLFDRPTATNPNLPLQYYEKYPIDDQDNGIRYWWDKGKQGPFSVDQSFLIYSNLPRSYSFGIIFDF